jgi:hypothetical protein
MKNYFLTIFGDFRDLKVLEEILSMMLPVIDSPRAKFQRMNNCVLMHFSTEVDQEEVYYFLEGGMNELYSGFVLTQMDDKVMINFPQEVKDHLLDLNTSDITNEKIIRLDLRQPDFDETKFQEFEIEYDEEDDEPFIKSFINHIKPKKIIKPSLNELLDKINSNGMNSLSKDEIKELENYSKNF